MDPRVKVYLQTIGRRGGRISRRVLSPEAARSMVKVREARRAFRRFHTQCFWSFNPAYVITVDDVSWVARQLDGARWPGRLGAGREAMPLTEFRADVAKLMAVQRSPDSYLAGGAAMHIEPLSTRYSNDLDSCPIRELELNHPIANVRGA